MKLIACLLFFLLFAFSEAKVRYNSQIQPPYNIQLADLTGDGIAEFYLFNGVKVYATTTDFIVHGLAYLRLPAAPSRIISGKFTGGPKDILCAQETSLARLDCYSMNSTNDALWWWWYQSDFIGTDQVIVGDYNGDGFDDILCYAPTTGVFRVYIWNPSTNLFEVMANWAPGNLGTGTLKNMQIRAGDFGTPDGISDLLVYNPTLGQALVYGAVYNSSISQYTFWWVFTTASGWGGSNWEVLTADLNGDGTDDAVLHDTVNGYYNTYTVAWNPANSMMPVLSVSLGDIHQGTNSKAIFTKLKNIPSEDGGKTNLRDDIMVYSYSSQLWIRSDARFNGTQTYWWVYTQYPLIVTADQDGDAILTGHELGGYDPNNDGVSDGILNSYGASPFLKDIFVEVDYMAGPPGASWDYAMDPTAVSLAVSTLAAKNINLHIFISNQVPYTANLGNPTFNWARDFDPIKNANFAATRVPFFHYCLFGNNYNGATSSGISRAIVASDFLVTLGTNITIGRQVGTFLHELGHNLGLRHGSTDDTNYKANHLSIMNYNYQFGGIYKNGAYQYLYSDIACSDLNEIIVNDNAGVQCTVSGSDTYQTLVTYLHAWRSINTPIDWNNNGVYDSSTFLIDSNLDGLYSLVKGGVNEFGILKFNGGQIGSAAAKRAEVPPISESEPLLDEPPRETLPTSSETHRTDFSSLRLARHNGTQFLDSPLRRPAELFEKDEDAFVSRPRDPVASPAAAEGAGGAARAQEHAGAVNSEYFTFVVTTPVYEFAEASPMPNSAVNDLFK